MTVWMKSVMLPNVSERSGSAIRLGDVVATNHDPQI